MGAHKHDKTDLVVQHLQLLLPLDLVEFFVRTVLVEVQVFALFLDPPGEGGVPTPVEGRLGILEFEHVLQKQWLVDLDLCCSLQKMFMKFLKILPRCKCTYASFEFVCAN